MNRKQIKILIGSWRDNDLYQDRGDGAQINIDDLSMVGQIKVKCDENIIPPAPGDYREGPTITQNIVYYRWFYLKGNPNSFIMYSKNIKDLDILGWEDQKEEEKE